MCSTIVGQTATLEGAVAEQRGGNVSEAVGAQILESRRALDASAALRVGEAEEAASKLGEQQRGLEALLDEQSGLRDEMMKQVLGGVEKLVSEHLAKLASQAASGVQLAMRRAEKVAAITTSSAEATLQVASEMGASSERLIETTAAWGRSNDAVASQMGVAIEKASRANPDPNPNEEAT